jgi:tRNA-dihydrouridine synthase B
MKTNFLNRDTPLILAPMDDVTDIPFRRICRQLGADIVMTEFTSCEALIRGIPKSLARIRIQPDEHPVGIQLFGSRVESMEKAVDIASQLQPDFIDINCGCWARNHAQRGEGAALLKDLPLLERIVAAVVKTSPVPVTVKTRLGWDQNSIVILDVARIVEQAGAQALTIHCRTRNQAYKGAADWQWLAKVKATISIPVIGNGDVQTPVDVRAMLDLGCDGVMIGREAIINPWIFKMSRHYLETGEESLPPSPGERFQICLQHLNLAEQYKSPRWGTVHLRKHFIGYIRGFPEAAHIRSSLFKISDLGILRETLLAYQDHYLRVV